MRYRNAVVSIPARALQMILCFLQKKLWDERDTQEEPLVELGLGVNLWHLSPKVMGTPLHFTIHLSRDRENGSARHLRSGKFHPGCSSFATMILHC